MIIFLITKKRLQAFVEFIRKSNYVRCDEDIYSYLDSKNKNVKVNVDDKLIFSWPYRTLIPFSLRLNIFHSPNDFKKTIFILKKSNHLYWTSHWIQVKKTVYYAKIVYTNKMGRKQSHTYDLKEKDKRSLRIQKEKVVESNKNK